MTHLPRSPQPPRRAVWLVDLFTPVDQAESLLGDLHEEFLDLASTSGLAYAHHWYWRQTLKTVAHLSVAAFRIAPSLLVGTVLVGILLSWLGARLPEQLIVVLLRTQRPYSNLHVAAYIRFVTYGLPVAIITQSLLVGCVVATLAKGREMAATIALSMIGGVPILFLLLMQTTPYPRLVPGLGPYLFLRAIELIAIVVAGALVRKFRSSRAPRHAVL